MTDSNAPSLGLACSRIAADWIGAMEQDDSSEATIHALFEAQARRTPNAVAVVFEGLKLTYQELNKRADLLAEYLRGLGAGPELLIGICLERSLELVVGLLGIL